MDVGIGVALSGGPDNADGIDGKMWLLLRVYVRFF